MAIIRGSYYYKAKREYKYEVNVHDADSYGTMDFNIKVTNPEGNTAIVSWNFRARGIEASIMDYIQTMASKKK